MAASYPDHPELQLALANGAVIILVLYEHLSDRDRKAWCERLDAALARSRVNDHDFAAIVNWTVGFLTNDSKRKNAIDVLVRLARLRPEFIVGNGTNARSLAERIAEFLDRSDDDHPRESQD